MPDKEAGVHIAPRLAGEGGGTDKETLRSNRPAVGNPNPYILYNYIQYTVYTGIPGIII